VLATGVLVGMLVSQLDRVVLSRSLDAAAYGSYVVVANLGLAFMQLQYPLMRAFFPRAVLASAGGAVDGKSSSQVLAVIVLCVAPCLLCIAFAPWVLHAWLGDTPVAAAGVSPLRLILAAVAVNSIYHLMYQQIVAAGQNQVVISINLMVLLVTAPVLFFIAPSMGAPAGGIAWLLASVLQLGLGAGWLIRHQAATKKQ
jgi:O-antigen/teichoic acid export membrane protein